MSITFNRLTFLHPIPQLWVETLIISLIAKKWLRAPRALSPHSTTQEADRINLQHKHLTCNVRFLAVGTSGFSSLTYFIPHRELDTQQNGIFHKCHPQCQILEMTARFFWSAPAAFLPLEKYLFTYPLKIRLKIISSLKRILTLQRESVTIPSAKS